MTWWMWLLLAVPLYVIAVGFVAALMRGAALADRIEGHGKQTAARNRVKR